MAENIVAAILEEIRKERERQVEKVGWDKDFDAKNTINDWNAYVTVYCGKAVAWHPDNPDFETAKKKWRENLVKVAALTVAAIESLDLNYGPAPRHYDFESVLPDEPEA